MVWSQRAAYMPAWGNHEWSDPQRDDLRNYKGRFALPHAAASPGAPAISCCGEDWYWFDFGSVRFIIYPEPYTHDTWIDWAKQAEPLFVGGGGEPAHQVRDHRRTPPGLLVGPPRQRSAAARDPRRVRQAVSKVRAQPERAQPRLRADEAAGARRAHHRRNGRRRARARGDAPACGTSASRPRSPPSAPSTTASSRFRCARRSCGSRRSAVRPRPATKTSPAATARSSTRSSSRPAAP